MFSQRIFRLLGASIFATSAMTAFSYVLSKVCKQNFIEPDLLSKVISRQAFPDRKAIVEGWTAHYVIGMLWSVVYVIPNEGISGTFRISHKARGLGMTSGLIAVAAWRIMLERHPQTLKITSKTFFVQLMPAHMVYAFTLVWQSRSLGSRRSSTKA